MLFLEMLGLSLGCYWKKRSVVLSCSKAEGHAIAIVKPLICEPSERTWEGVILPLSLRKVIADLHNDHSHRVLALQAMLQALLVKGFGVGRSQDSREIAGNASEAMEAGDKTEIDSFEIPVYAVTITINLLA
jgi:hypothetical protein